MSVQQKSQHFKTVNFARVSKLLAVLPKKQRNYCKRLRFTANLQHKNYNFGEKHLLQALYCNWKNSGRCLHHMQQVINKIANTFFQFVNRNHEYLIFLIWL